MKAVDLGSTVRRTPMTDLLEAYSGASLERVELADGRRLVVKHLAPDGDWLTRATVGDGRVRSMWTSGALDGIARVVDHTILDVVSVNGHDAVVMRDATSDLVPPGPVPRDVSRRLLAGLAAIHAGCADVTFPGPCTVAARYTMFSPGWISTDRSRPGSHPSTDFILEGWERFFEVVDGDVAGAVREVHQDAAWLGDRLARFPSTLLHGDAKLDNLGLGADRLVAIDWADITGFGPREVDVAWYALKGCDRIGCTPDAIFADYEEVGRVRLDPEALDLVCIGSLAQMGFRLALQAHGQPSASASALLGWWVARARSALERLG